MKAESSPRHASATTAVDLMPRLAHALAREPSVSDKRWQGSELALLPDKGLAHHHVRIGGHGVLARIPKQSQLQLDARANLAYQAACFERASASGHAPRLFAVLPPGAELPRGALIVEEIGGRPAALPKDLDAIAVALAQIHALPLPNTDARAPLQDAADPLAALQQEIEAQAAHLDAARIDPAVRAAIDSERGRLRAICAHSARPEKRLISFDAHPGNFVVRADGSAVLVDLEKCRYSYPSLDLAHATLYTSTTWEPESFAVLRPGQVGAAYTRWHESFGDGAESMRQWHLPLRRAMWLWSMTWCAKWRVLSGAKAHAAADGEDWSGALSDAALIHHVRGRVDDYLSPAAVRFVLEDFDAF